MDAPRVGTTRSTHIRWAWILLLPAATLIGACSGDDEVSLPAPTTATGGTGGAGAATGGSTSTGGAGGDTGGAGGSGGALIECPQDPLVSGEHQRTIAFGGHDRSYEVQVPISYDNMAPVPLVFDIHGYSSNKDQQQLVSGFDDLAEQEGFVVVRPNGYGLLRSWNAGDFCCGSAQDENLDDVGLMKAIVQELSAQLCIHPRRIYATGISNGGAMSHRLACEAADVFAAVAPVSYPLDFTPFSQCQPSRPIAVMHSHGLGDITVPYDGSGFMQPTPDSFAYWALVNGCTGDPVVTYQNDNSVCETYQSCYDGVEVALCSVDGGHVLYINADDVPIATLSWQFLSSHTLP